jgi:DNA-binding NarL/FixJ family response regulator
MHTRVKVAVSAVDPIMKSGTEALLRGRPEVDLVEGTEATGAEVVIVSTDAVDESTLQNLRRYQCEQGSPRVVLVSALLDESDVLKAVEFGVVGALRRAEATPERVVQAVRSAATGEGVLSPDLLGRLLQQVRDVQTRLLSPRGLHFSGLSERETAVLRLVADGFDTREIASELAYSERTIKNLIQDVTRRFGLRNRSHAVAYALRQGLI